ncbi:prolyl-tRNA synthetase associated domain-containing protein [Planomicrobium sp. CPCC 101110]|uniref:prolyl-tRNA synthetase associated domain-containing protein n=1 Tax=Planomicrobium sp. CPCC 101110 TaxID=2599619 RepID=UPI0011B8369B|nr:YbaK/EbsC family protein [Planomicrobium sp. CPCC 101110]TWT27218.1 prolyl-tRNA synthetase associated domain-containing protein [Planomicrobium sp. CPCC 101110]
MFFVSDILETAPTDYKSPLQKMVYETLAKLHIFFERVDTDEAISMEECIEINQKLNMKMVKTLFLCNSQKTEFYLFITAAAKPFKSKNFSNALGISRVSFAPAEMMESILGTKVGAATVFGVLMDNDELVQVVVDEEILLEEWYGCSDGTTTGYMKVKTKEIIDIFLPSAKHIPVVIPYKI